MLFRALFLIGFLLSFSGFATEVRKPVFLVIEFSHNDPTNLSKGIAQQIVKDTKIRTAYLHVETVQELKSALTNVLKSNEVIRGLVFSSHSGNINENGKQIAGFSSYGWGNYEDMYFSIPDAATLNPTPLLSATDIFSGIYGRFEDGATIVLAGCKPVLKDKKTATLQFNEFAKVFGLKDGQIFASYNFTSAARDYFFEPFNFKFWKWIKKDYGMIPFILVPTIMTLPALAALATRNTEPSDLVSAGLLAATPLFLLSVMNNGYLAKISAGSTVTVIKKRLGTAVGMLRKSTSCNKALN